MRAILSPKGIIGLSLVTVFTLVAIGAPFLVPEELTTKINVLVRLKPPSIEHPFGTDQLGRELVWRVLLGAHTSLVIAVLAVALSLVIGLPLGVVSGYFGGWTDHSLMRLVDTLLSFPVLLLALTISAVLGPNLPNTILAIGIAFTPYLSRIVRGETLRVAALPYVEAARSQGASNWRIIRLHIVPNIMAPVIVQATISIAFAILAEAALSFLGLGTQPPTPSWGLMIQASRDYLDVAAWTALVPGIAVAATVLGLNMLGDVLRDVLDPTIMTER
ncbi:MAG: ABC transporter permease [Immundisolibacterales bacterium]|nr:ABC transporter permease [Immundisolibacterales bacterium]